MGKYEKNIILSGGRPIVGSNWLKKVENDIYAATCTMCGATILVKNGGKSQLEKHAMTMLAAIFNNETSQSTFTLKSTGLYDIGR